MLERNYPPEYDKKLNAQRLREGLENHIRMVAEKALSKYGKIDSFETFLEMLDDREIVRFPSIIDFKDPAGKEKHCVRLDKMGEEDNECYQISLHSHFRGRDKDVIALSVYHLVKINYGKIAKGKEALLFGSLLLNITEDEYKKWIKKLEDEV